MNSSISKTILRALKFLVWAGAIFFAALTLWLAFVGLSYPYQLDYGEGIVLWFAQQIARGAPIYKALEGYPYASSNYPPLALWLSAALMPIFGDGYFSGRLLNFAAALVTAALIFRIVKSETRAARAAALAALFFFGAPYVYHWIPLFRVDLIGLAFAFAGIYFVWAWERRRQTADRRQILYFCLFTFCFLLALYAKHTLIAAPAAAFLAIFARDTCTATHAVRCKCKRAAVLFALALGATGGAIYLALDAATRGAFTFGLITSNATVFLTDQLIALLKNFALTFAPLIVLAAWELFARIRARRLGVLEWYAVTSFAFLIFAGRVGAWENYFFEAIVAVCVLAGYRIGRSQMAERRWQSADSKERPTNYELLITNYALPLLLLVQLIAYWHDPRIAADLIARDQPANRELAALLARTPNPIISEDMGALATSGKQVAYYTFQYSSLARAGGWDQHWELDGLRDGIFPLVILERGTREDVERYRRLTREFVSALDRYYAQAQTIGKYEIYSPAPLLHLQAAKFGGEIAMIGWSIAQSGVQSPESNVQPLTSNLQLSVVWQAQRAMTRRYTAFVHLENARGEKIAQEDREPRDGIYPTTRWGAGEMVREVYTLNVPSDMPRGKYFLKVGWYDSESGERLSVAGSAENVVVIETFEQ